MNVNTAFDTRLEERLRQTDLLGANQITEARDLQKESPLSLAEALVRLELLSVSEVDQIISSLQEMRTVKLEEIQIDSEAVKHVPRHVAAATKCIPIRRTGNTLVVAASDADASKVREELRSVTDFDIVILIAEHDALEHALFVYYGDEPSGKSSTTGSSELRRSSNPWTICSPWPQTFDSFIDHAACEHAREIAKQVASGNWDSYNSPIVIVGDNNTGKSHLLDAIKNYCTSKEPTMRGIVCKGSELKNLIADYSVCGKLQALRFELRECSLLIIDDFAGLWGDEGIENEVASNIANLKAQGAAVVVAMTDEQFLAQPTSAFLRAEIEGGTVTRLGKPDPKCLKKIVEQRCGHDSKELCAFVTSAIESGPLEWSAIQSLATSRLIPKS